MKTFRNLFLLGLFEVLYLVVILLKLNAVSLVASWAWAWILCPIWIPISLLLLLGFYVLVYILFVALFRSYKTGREALRN